MKKIFLTVTNDLTYDQRMHRICSTLEKNNFSVTLIGRILPSSIHLDKGAYNQKRINCWFKKGKLFYTEYNTRLFFYLLFKKMDAVCAVDLDTILPCFFVSKLKRIKRIYDAHELFSELKEVVSRRAIKRIWTRVEKFTVPKFKYGYTVSDSIAEEFRLRYGVEYKTIRNVPSLEKIGIASNKNEKFILYQGAVNEARGFEYLIPAMQWINSKLVICGDGNFMTQLRELVREYKVESKIELRGMLPPAELKTISQKATIGLALAENVGLNQYHALPNKFFDYIHAELPQITMNFPEYIKINNQYEVAILVDDLSPQRIAETVNNLLEDDVLYLKLKANCSKAREDLNWQNEEKKLLSFYQSLFKI